MSSNSNIANYLLPHITKYRLSEEIGSGTYGVVYKGLRKDDGKNIALKRIFVTDKDGNNNIPLSTHRELCALKKLNSYDNKNIVKLFDVVLNKIDGKMCMDLIFELGDYDLEKYLKKFNSAGDMPIHKIINLSRQMFDAIYFMHSCCIIHRDLKPANILINKDGTDLKITDFGLARILGFDSSLTPVVVTLWYRSPEILLQRSYLTACDIWSGGCIVAEMIYGLPVFAGDNEISQIEKIVMRLGFEAIDNWPEDNLVNSVGLIKLIDNSRSLDCILKRVDRSVLHLVKELLRFDPDSRILSSEAIQELDRIKLQLRLTPIDTCTNCSNSSLPGLVCLGGDCEINTENEMIVNSVVRNVLDDDFMNEPKQAGLIHEIPGIDDNDSITCYPYEQVEIEAKKSDKEEIEDDSIGYYRGTSTECSETDSCSEGYHEEEEEQINHQKESDEVCDSFSSYRSQDNRSLSSYAPSSCHGAESTDDDHVSTSVDKEIDEFHEFKNGFIISDKSEPSTICEGNDDNNINENALDEDRSLDSIHKHGRTNEKYETLKSADHSFLVNDKTKERINSTPFKEINDQIRLSTSPKRTPGASQHFQRKRVLNSDDSSESENGIAHMSPILNSAAKPNLTRHKSLRRRVSILGPHTQLESKSKSFLNRNRSVLVTPITENEECRDMSFGEKSLARALDTVATSQLTDRPKIAVRRRSTLRKA